MKIRIAWFDKSNNKYNVGDWREKTDIIQLKKWIIEQNELYNNQHYWLEFMDKNKVKNFNWEKEDYEYVKIVT